MKRRCSDIRGQGLLETIVALGVILAGTVGTISLLIATMNAGRASVNTEIATNLAREAIEVARNIRDQNWLQIQSNEPGINTFDSLFENVAPYHHMRIPVFTRKWHHSNFEFSVGSYPDGSYWNTWDLKDITNYKNYNTADSTYNLPIEYNSVNPEQTECVFKYNSGTLDTNCARVFQNFDTFGNAGFGYGYFNLLPPNPIPANEYTPDFYDYMVDDDYMDYYADDHTHYRTTTELYPLDPLDDCPGNDCVHPTTETPFSRWLTMNPICRKDVNGDGIPDLLPAEPTSEYIVTKDDGTVDSTCATDDIMVGLQVISTVTWGPQCPGTGCTCPGKDCVQVEDRLYNWKFVK